MGGAPTPKWDAIGFDPQPDGVGPAASINKTSLKMPLCRTAAELGRGAMTACSRVASPAPGVSAPSGAGFVGMGQK